MKKYNHPQHRCTHCLCAIHQPILPNAHAAYKCQGADGKVEYSDRPCEVTKSTLDQPKASTGAVTRTVGNPMVQLEKIFVDYFARLCEREKLSGEMSEASRKGDVAKQPAAWKVKQDRLIELNEVLVDFQQRTNAITKAQGSDSKEMAALRKYQSSFKNCDMAKPYVTPVTPVAAPATAETAPKANPNNKASPK
ncbi:MAG: hypothetical protein HC782_03145 [Gammaproteobacteria bacterium]|nr:hypothetical protein [Gammaproteobacteria bacterium]